MLTVTDSKTGSSPDLLAIASSATMRATTRRGGTCHDLAKRQTHADARNDSRAGTSRPSPRCAPPASVVARAGGAEAMPNRTHQRQDRSAGPASWRAWAAKVVKVDGDTAPWSHWRTTKLEKAAGRTNNLLTRPRMLGPSPRPSRDLTALSGYVAQWSKRIPVSRTDRLKGANMESKMVLSRLWNLRNHAYRAPNTRPKFECGCQKRSGAEIGCAIKTHGLDVHIAKLETNNFQ